MPVAPVKSSQRPKLMIRRGKKVTEGVEVQTVFEDIKSGHLKPKHEFSTDGVNWRRLDSHPQLARVFATVPEPEPMKKGPLIFLLLVVLMALGAGMYFHPYLAFYKVQTAVDSRNVQKLSEWVDYSRLHQSVKSQLDAQWNEMSEAQISQTPYAKTALPAGRLQTDQMIKALATPDAVMDFVKGKTGRIVSQVKEAPKSPVEGESSAGDPLTDLGLNIDSANKILDSVNAALAKGEFRYEGLNTFVVTTQADNGENFEFAYERDGLGWKMSGITLPLTPVRFSVNDIVQSVLKDAQAKVRTTRKPKKSKVEKSKPSQKKVSPQVAKLQSGEKAYMANLQITNLSVGKGKKYLFGSPNPGLFATLKNKGNRILNEVEITVYFYNKKGAIVREKKLYPVSVSKYRPARDNDPLGPKKAKKIGYLVKEFAPSSWAGKVQMRVTDIVFKE